MPLLLPPPLDLVAVRYLPRLHCAFCTSMHPPLSASTTSQTICFRSTGVLSFRARSGRAQHCGIV
jgi:hypothetical protein